MKISLALLFLFAGSFLWPQSGSQIELHGVVADGNIRSLDEKITIQQLCYFNKTELRILRNTIYSKHGQLFASRDLQDHFSKFSWYEGRYTNADDRLSETDRENIRLIQIIESNYPVTVNPELVGRWRYFGAVPAEGISFRHKDPEDKGDMIIFGNGIYLVKGNWNSYSQGRATGYGLWTLTHDFFRAVLIENQHEIGSVSATKPFGGNYNFSIHLFEDNDGYITEACSFFDFGSWYKVWDEP
ncbi:MAG: YARHG domain-containing protein [Treponema sp.]|jgi:hypothetical protein|nr:YARHG domain-containing protein [Treponema sp.]